MCIGAMTLGSTSDRLGRRTTVLVGPGGMVRHLPDRRAVPLALAGLATLLVNGARGAPGAVAAETGTTAQETVPA